LAVVAKALIAGRIDCKTAGRLIVHLQTISKLLWLYHRGHRGTQREKLLTTKDTKGHEGLPRICSDERRLDREQETSVLPASQADARFAIGNCMYDAEPRVAIDRKIREFPEESRSAQHGKWEQPRAA
jgi:hypothetical protein